MPPLDAEYLPRQGDLSQHWPDQQGSTGRNEKPASMPVTFDPIKKWTKAFLLDRVFRSLITKGSLWVRYPDGSGAQYRGGDGPSAGMHILTQAAMRRLLTNPSLALGECYMDGSIVPLGCSLYEMLDVLMYNQQIHQPSLGAALYDRMRSVLSRWSQYNPAGRSRRNVAVHYDLDDRLYSLFLDLDRQYSCAYFATGDESLEAAQKAKKHHIATKLLLDRPGMRVLDIGSGWGGMALTLAAEYGANVTGITLSEEQLTAARARVAAAGLGEQVQFKLMDYRDPALQSGGPFDRVVSVGMFEHVGTNHYATFFRTLSALMTESGVGLLHAIGRSDGPYRTNPWLAKYIFPGGYSPALSEVLPIVERSGLIVTDIEILRLHYAFTLRHWRESFAARRAEIARIYDEPFCRMFDFYLTGSELAFRRQRHINWQMQVTRDLTSIPLTRDYLYSKQPRQ